VSTRHRPSLGASRLPPMGDRSPEPAHRRKPGSVCWPQQSRQPARIRSGSAFGLDRPAGAGCGKPGAVRPRTARLLRRPGLIAPEPARRSVGAGLHLAAYRTCQRSQEPSQPSTSHSSVPVNSRLWNSHSGLTSLSLPIPNRTPLRTFLRLPIGRFRKHHLLGRTDPPGTRPRATECRLALWRPDPPHVMPLTSHEPDRLATVLALHDSPLS